MSPNRNTPRTQYLWLPLVIAVAVVVGSFIGSRFSNRHYAIDNDRKLNTILNLIVSEYVDTVNMNQLIELSIPQILANLDPHTLYFNAEELREANEELGGSFSGICISFMIMNDTVNVI